MIGYRAERTFSKGDLEVTIEVVRADEDKVILKKREMYKDDMFPACYTSFGKVSVYDLRALLESPELPVIITVSDFHVLYDNGPGSGAGHDIFEGGEISLSMQEEADFIREFLAEF